MGFTCMKLHFERMKNQFLVELPGHFECLFLKDQLLIFDLQLMTNKTK